MEKKVVTNGDILVQILHEVSGRPRSVFEAILSHIKDQFPGQHKLDMVLSEKEAEQQLMDLRKEKAGILAWCLRGIMKSNAQNKISLAD